MVGKGPPYKAIGTANTNLVDLWRVASILAR